MSRRPVVVFTELADRDVDGQYAWIARDNLRAADRFIAAIERTVNALARFPQTGRLRRLRPRRLHGMRSRAVSGFASILVFYRPTRDGIEVVRVLHGARDIPRVLDEKG